MTLLLSSLLITIIMPFLAKAPLAVAMNKESKYDNAYPRDQQARLTGFGARANAAHYNCFEALACYTPAVLAVIATSNVNELAELSALVFVLARVLYLLCYWFDKATLRSACWIVAMAALFTLFAQAF
ncbi:MAPEG family protein [Alteromonas sediminis]|uniref:MAPEG family protein n=1 Tax=Alteromonas sediminis TaxID=2259342 RepID=A0A3N5Y4R5_9ALTE|nr:MAPEG family protein [Alteromonas sediminis]RPJ67896.1 MAPEG family protein [Alteromonas sediminis]